MIPLQNIFLTYYLIYQYYIWKPGDYIFLLMQSVYTFGLSGFGIYGVVYWFKCIIRIRDNFDFLLQGLGLTIAVLVIFSLICGYWFLIDHTINKNIFTAMFEDPIRLSFSFSFILSPVQYRQEAVNLYIICLSIYEISCSFSLDPLWRIIFSAFVLIMLVITFVCFLVYLESERDLVFKIFGHTFLSSTLIFFIIITIWVTWVSMPILGWWI